MNVTAPVFRFAPSPNGYLHLGHAFSALFGYRMARRFDGRFLLRIEDIDGERSRPEFEQAIYEDLEWLGVEWEQPVRRQSEHMADYAAILTRLQALGVVYPCFATRKEIAAAVEASGKSPQRDPDGAYLYPGLYRDLPLDTAVIRISGGEPYALRLNMQRALEIARDKACGAPLSYGIFDEDRSVTRTEANPERWGDVVLGRKDTPASYHIAVVADDRVQGVTHVTRGLDLLAATDIHRLLQALLDLPEPVYCHHRLITDAAGRKLSKSHSDKALRSLRAEGASPDDIRRMVGLPPGSGTD